MATKTTKTTARKPAGKKASKPAAKAGTKTAQLLTLLGRGATVAELCKALGWLPQTLRAAISRLDAKVQRNRSAEGVTSYRIGGAKKSAQ